MNSNFTLKVKRRSFVVLGLSFTASIIWLLAASQSERYVLLPTLTFANTAVYFFITLWNRDNELPLFEIGTVYMLATSCYALVPFLGYLFSGLTYTPISTLTLYLYNPGPVEFSTFAWRYVVYFLSFCAVYLTVRGSAVLHKTNFNRPSGATIKFLIALFLVLLGYFLLLKVFYGVNLNPAYDSNLSETFDKFLALPLLLRQITQNLYGISFLLQLSLLIAIFAYWDSRYSRYILFAWTAFALTNYVFNIGARTGLILFFLSIAVLYHRFVKPLKLMFCAVAGASALACFIVFGIMRGGPDIGSNFKKLAELKSYDIKSLFSVSNEFECVFAGNYDLYRMKKDGVITNVPWQLHVSEFIQLVPQQFLSFEKIDPQVFYLSKAKRFSYFMYGPIAQSVLGLDWLELIFRGGLLGWIFAVMHRWYIKRPQSFWVTLLYCFLIVRSYNSIRSPTFSFIYMIIFQFLPLFIIVIIFRELFISKPVLADTRSEKTAQGALK